LSFLLMSLEHGATITLADVNDTAGAAVAASLDRVTYVYCDVSSWDSLTSLFKSALSHGPIDIVLSNAGVSGLDSLLESDLSPSGDLLPPTLPGLDVNLTATLLITKLALHYFRQQGYGRLIYTGSAASYLDTPQLWTYTAAKHGVLGLMRSLRSVVGQWGDITVNMAAPWFTVTPMAAVLGPKWGDRPVNSPKGVAKALIFAAVGKEWRVGGVNGEQQQGAPVNGCTFWIGGDKVVELEEGIWNARGMWMGEEMASAVNEGQKALGGW
jgi:NAD(P)-dependent dehydrogenase (short-subunit alcohol dehydrogenase family)